MTTPGDLFSSSAFVEKIVKSAMASCFGDPSAFWNLFEFRDPLGSKMMRVAEECSAGLKKPPPPAEAPLSMSRLSMSKVIAGCSSRWVMLGQSVVGFTLSVPPGEWGRHGPEADAHEGGYTDQGDGADEDGSPDHETSLCVNRAWSAAISSASPLNASLFFKNSA